MLPVRCDFQREDGVITFCAGSIATAVPGTCMVWDSYSPATPEDATPHYFAEQLALRSEGIREIYREATMGNLSNFETFVMYNDNPSVALV